MNRIVIYLAANAVFFALLAIGYTVGGQSNPRLAYLVLLFALCSTSIIDLDGLNGRYALLSIFLSMYFVYFGVQDVTNLFNGELTELADGSISDTEAVILIGALMLIIGYRVAARARGSVARAPYSFDWSLRSILFVGIGLFCMGTAATYFWFFQVVPDKTLEGTKGIAMLSPLLTAGLILGQILQPLGILLLAYAWTSTKGSFYLAILLVAIAVQVLFGFVIDIKGMALSGGSLVVATIIFADGRVPKAWIAMVALFVYVAFPVFQAYRSVVSGNGIARSQVLDNLGKTLEVVLAAKERVNNGQHRAQTIFERLSMKSSVGMIVRGTAAGIPFQHGYTLTPILATFVPKLLWSDKPDVPTGRIINRVFHVTDQEETYISPSHLGELYWNYGWPGVIVGMTVIGGIVGFVARFNLAECRTVTRLLVMVVTIESLIHGFEGSMAGSYVVWLRTMAAIGLLHLILARVRVAGRGLSVVVPNSASEEEESAPRFHRFPNLLN